MNSFTAELSKPEYAGLNDADAAARLNEPHVVGRRPVPLADFVYRFFSDATWAALQAAANAPPPTDAAAAQVRAAAITVYDYLRNPHVESIDMDLPATKAVLATLVQAGVLPQTLVAEIDALANVTQTRAAAAGLPSPVPVAAVTAARRKRK